MSYRVAVVGATGSVGREMLNTLAERQFPASEVVALASTRSTGTEVSFGNGTLKVKALDYFDFSGTQLCLMSAGSAVSKEWSPKITAKGAIVIDNSSQWRMDRDVPLIVPEVNAHVLDGGIKKGIIANPNCSTAQMVVALKPLHDAARIKRVVVSTYQSVSGAGRDAMDELFRQTRAVFVADPIEKGKFTKQIAFNVIPHIDVFLDSGFTKEEWKMMVETQKNSRSRYPGDRDLCPCPRFCRSLRGDRGRIRKTDYGRKGSLDPARRARSACGRCQKGWRIHHAGGSGR